MVSVPMCERKSNASPRWALRFPPKGNVVKHFRSVGLARVPASVPRKGALPRPTTFEIPDFTGLKMLHSVVESGSPPPFGNRLRDCTVVRFEELFGSNFGLFLDPICYVSLPLFASRWEKTMAKLFPKGYRVGITRNKHWRCGYRPRAFTDGRTAGLDNRRAQRSMTDGRCFGGGAVWAKVRPPDRAVKMLWRIGKGFLSEKGGALVKDPVGRVVFRVRCSKYVQHLRHFSLLP